MKKISLQIKSFGCAFDSFIGKRIQTAFVKAAVLVMITALLLPLIIFQPLTKVSAKTNEPIVNSPAPASVPPLPFALSGSAENNFIPASVSNFFSPINDFFTAPELPSGFSAARTESTACSYVSSLGDKLASGFAFISSAVSPTASASNPPSNGTEFDYDGDGKADPAVWNQAGGNWQIKRSSDGTVSTTNFGATAAFATPGDFDGDSISDPAVFHQGDWGIFQSATSTVLNIPLGAAGDRPVSGDFNGDGMSDAAVFRPSTGGWIIRNSTNGTITTTVWGLSSDVLVPADYDGDGKTDIAVFRDGNWYILGSSAGYYGLAWGLGSDLPVAADFDGDGKADLAVFRPSTGSWYILKSSSTTGESISQAWGNYNDQPVPADYDGDGKADFAVFRPKTGMWHILKSSDWGYQPHTLGIASDKLVEAAYLKQNGSIAFDNAFARTRLSPKNATGGTNLYSQNFGWGSGLVGLSGRNGLDAGFGIGYNSLVWIKHNNTMVFDPDQSNTAPGFRFGFSTIEPIYYDGTTEKYTYMMVSPSGARTEFRQTLVSNVYQTADSSYLQITANGANDPNDPAENITLTVRGTDGTQMNYEYKGGAYHPAQIKDRNGNFISIVHDDYGLLRSVTDTLGRVITVNYDSDNYPTSVTGVWNNNNGEGTAYTRTYATFGYATKTITPSFATGIGIYGPNGSQIKMLDKIIYGDAANNTGETRFEYNDFGQVKKVRNFAQDLHELNYTTTNLDTPGTLLTNVPRLIETRSWAENFNGIGGIPEETVVTNNLLEGQQVTDLNGQTVSAKLIQVGLAGHPNGNITNSYVGAGGWMEGLPILTNDYTNEGGYQLRRSSWTQWTQDNPNLSYIENPRTTATKIGDDVSTRKTEIIYKMQSGNSSLTDNGLVTEVRIYDEASNTLLKKSTTQYNENAVYLSRRIIGLPLQSESYGLNQQTSQLEKISKITYEYDAGNFSDGNLQQTISPIQHDTTNYGASFVVGRANLTSTTRHDVSGQSSAVPSSIKYNTAGNPVASIDPLGRQSKIIYADSFNDGNNNRNTFAYPTKLIDAAGNFSEVKYRFDIGANVWAQSPTPYGTNNNIGKTTARIYDALGRLERETLVNSGAYTRYEYPANQIQSKVWTTVIDTNGSNGADAADEVYAESWADGAGRVLRSRTEHPGSIGGWSGSVVEYDKLGQVKRSTVPTEIAVSGITWTPAGDDANGWLWTSQVYDWKGRVIQEFNTDGTDRLYSYDGCGCAGGQVTTVKSELVPRDDQPNNTGRRTQKIYADVLGRTWKTEVLNWDGITPYTTTVQGFNGRDQVFKTRQYAGATSGSTYQTLSSSVAYQDVTMSYDGHGRMKTRRYPVEDAGTNTTWSYNADDSIQMVIDPRGAITNFSYEAQGGLLNQISYDQPANPPAYTTIPDSPTVNFTYDALGNRTKMDTVGVSEINYNYDELSRLTSEMVDFDDLTENFTIGYTYHLGGALKSITDPLNSTVNYTNDRTGRLTAVTGTAWGENTTGNYASGITYRAFGKLKQINYTLPDETAQIKMDYDSRLRVNHSEVVTNKMTSGYLMKADFAYSADSRLQAKDDLLDDKWDRTNKYDHAGRLTFNQFGMGEASDFPGTYKRVYEQNIAYDTFSMMTSRWGVHWGNGIGFSESYTNGRINNPNVIYDAAGNIGDSNVNNQNPHEFQRSTFDASGRRTISHSSVKGRWGSIMNMVTEKKDVIAFDGDGHPVVEKSGYQNYHAVTGTPPTTGWQPPIRSYQVWSTVLGGSLMTYHPANDYRAVNVYAGGAVIAEKTRGVENNQTVEHTGWKTSDPVTGTQAVFNQYGAVKLEEIEPLGQAIAFHDSSAPPEPEPNQVPERRNADDPHWQCEADKGFWGGFTGYPFHCQKKMIQDLDYELKNLFGWGEQMENPSRIPGGQGQGEPPKFNQRSEEDYARRKALAATHKPDNEADNEGDDKAKPIMDASIPGFRDASQTNDPSDKEIEAALRALIPSVGPDYDFMSDFFEGLEEIRNEELLHCNNNDKLQKNLQKIIIDRNRIVTNPNSTSTEKRIEYGFVVQRINGQLIVGDVITTNTEFSVSFGKFAVGTVVAVFHTHPFEDFPSGGVKDINPNKKRKRTDVFSAAAGNYISYVYGPAGLTLFNPRNPIDDEGNIRKIKAAKCP